MSKVLVVGGAGYLGSVLVEELLNVGFSVRVLDRMFFGVEPLARVLDRIELVVADMRDIDASHFNDCSAVINLTTARSFSLASTSMVIRRRSQPRGTSAGSM